MIPFNASCITIIFETYNTTKYKWKPDIPFTPRLEASWQFIRVQRETLGYICHLSNVTMLRCPKYFLVNTLRTCWGQNTSILASHHCLVFWVTWEVLKWLVSTTRSMVNSVNLKFAKPHWKAEWRWKTFRLFPEPRRRKLKWHLPCLDKPFKQQKLEIL